MAQAPIILQSGAVARLPIGLRRGFRTRVNEFADGSEQRFSDFADPRRRYRINLDLMKGSERADWIEFYKDRKGKFGSFTFASPIENLLKQSEAFENAVWDKTNITAAASAGANDPFGIQSGRVRRITLDAFAAILSQDTSIIPAGENLQRKKGFPGTASCYFRQEGGQPLYSFQMSLEDDGLNEQFSQTVNLTSSWQRIDVGGQFDKENAGALIRLRFRDFTPTSVGSFFMFGAQLQPVLSVSDYMDKTEARSGVLTARFAEDEEREIVSINDIYDLKNLEIVEILAGT